MLRRLTITNLILIEEATIEFGAGFNVLSGETGSGKSAILGALNLVAGDRADTGMLRKGASKGEVVALFDLNSTSPIPHILAECGIDHDPTEELIIRRELSAKGKSRLFINNQPAQLALLCRITPYLIDSVGQHANQRLFQLDYHRSVVDLYGGLKDTLNAFQASWQTEKALTKELEELLANEAERLRECEVCRIELEELEAANIQEGEDETLFAEYSRLANSEEIAQYLDAIDLNSTGILGTLHQHQQAFERLIEMIPSLTETSKTYASALIELQEIAHTIDLERSSLEHNPHKMVEINKRLTLINRLKRKYGQSFAEINTYKENTAEKLYNLEHADDRIEELRTALDDAAKTTNTHAKILTEQRTAAAEKLQEAITRQIRSLNMAKADFRIDITPQQRTQSGDDTIEFFLAPNVGEDPIPVRGCASGGELSRVMLALQTLLSAKEQVPTVVFDEIDANIGGETASVVGEKLHQIGQNHQILCITHFPQVAKKADHHFQIAKEEKKGRTVTTVQPLSKKERPLELTRMAGEAS